MTAETITPNDDVTALSDRQLLERVCKQLDHLDTMLHDQGQKIAELDPLVPLIPRALALLDPGSAMRKKWGSRAVPKRETAPVHVGKTPADRPPMGA